MLVGKFPAWLKRSIEGATLTVDPEQWADDGRWPCLNAW